jgi:hypothetical protein
LGCQRRDLSSRALVEADQNPVARSGGVRGPGGGELGHRAATGRAKYVGLELHQQLVLRHAAVGPELSELLEPRIGEHRFREIERLVRRCLQRGARDVSFVGEARQADDHAARVVAPVRCEQTGEGRNEDHAFRALTERASVSTQMRRQ